MCLSVPDDVLRCCCLVVCVVYVACVELCVSTIVYLVVFCCLELY